MTPAKQKALYEQWKKAYYEGSPIATDEEFDLLEDQIREADPNWIGLKRTGSKIGKKTEVKLHVPMPSLDKVKAESPDSVNRAISKIAKFGDGLVVSEKLDGSSVQSVYIKGVLKKLITRGDGVNGKDISYFIPFLSNIPKKIDSVEPELVVRMEVCLPVKQYNEKWAGAFESSRVVASSLLNRQDVHAALEDLHFVVLRVLHPAYSLSSGLDYAKRLGFTVVQHTRLAISAYADYDWTDMLTTVLEKRKAKAVYELDGLVLFSDANKLPANTGERPEYGKAFKLNDLLNAPETEIIDIKWKASAFGVLVPRAQLKPIKFGNVTVQYAALHNAKWAHERGAGIGARVKVIRSGEIIPKIVAVTAPTKFTFPSKKVFGGYHWDATETALELDDPHDNEQAKALKIGRFFNALDMDKFGGGMAEKLVAAGYDTASMLSMKETDFRSLPGIEGSAKTYAAEMQKLRTGENDIVQLMVGSGCFKKGIGSTRLRVLADKDPELLTNLLRAENGAERLRAASGGTVFAETYEEGYPEFKRWLKTTGLKAVVVKEEVVGSGPLSGYAGSWTGYRSAEEEAHFKMLGGKVVPFGGKTNILFFLANGKKSSKVDKAHSQGIEVAGQYKTWVNKITQGK